MKRMFLAETVGFTKLDLTPEDVRDHFDEICDERGYRVFDTMMEAFDYAVGHMVAAGGGAPPTP